MTKSELKETAIALILESDEEKRNAAIDELSESDVRAMLKNVFHTIHGEKSQNK